MKHIFTYAWAAVADESEPCEHTTQVRVSDAPLHHHVVCMIRLSLGTYIDVTYTWCDVTQAWWR